MKKRFGLIFYQKKPKGIPKIGPIKMNETESMEVWTYGAKTWYKKKKKR